jgi:hypothetical protein
MSVTDALRAAHSSTPEPLKVFAGSLGALTVSYTGVMDALRLILLVLTIAYTAVKLANAWRDRDKT